MSTYNADQLQQLSAALDPKYELSLPQAEQLLEFVGLLKRWNSVHNLTAIRDSDDIVRKHILDSLSLQAFLGQGSVLDVGSGGGFPGIPLAIVRPQQAFTLVDSNQKKTAFLKEVKRKLSLTNVTVINGRVEQLGSDKG
ncbi:16S rRNA (guanine(527)-N(7))-methyltransferase RsmG, partial [bacterium]|nr:16S rRNA (guanine(527)-N(7))-methyltransferase RsmG [bacterium]